MPIQRDSYTPVRRGAGLLGSLALLASCETAAPTGVRMPGGPALDSDGSLASVDVYVHAAPDGWELFMSDRTAASLQTAQKTVFVYASAGDAGQAAGFWQARENGARAAVDSLAGAGAWACASQTVAGHPIRRCTKGSTVSWFLRLPDGNVTGAGFGGRGSMALLRDQGTALAAIDGSTTYSSWGDLTNTLLEIVVAEAGTLTAPFVEVHAPDFDRTANPRDHPDHFATADAVRAATMGRAWDHFWYAGNDVRNRPINLDATATAVKQKAFRAYDQVIFRAGFGSNWSEYQPLMSRTYFRAAPYVAAQPPAAPSNLVSAATSDTRVTLGWTDNASDETSFFVERAPDQGGAAGTYAQIASVGGNVTAYEDTGLPASTRFWYRVRANGSGGASAYTSASSATTQAPPPPPAAPSALQAAGASSTRIDLAWTDNAANETGVTVERAADAGGAPGTFAAVATLPANATSYMDMGLAAGASFWYRVRAFNSGGQSAYTAAARGTSLSSFTTHLYIHAHQDDWQLFMGEKAAASVQSVEKVVFIYATAGDAGQPAAYWQTREAGARASIDSLVSAGSWACGSQTVAGHSIRRCTKGNTVSWFMRLPDGAIGGAGFNGRGSMAQLRDNGTALSAVDGSTTYTSWNDLTNTILQIAATETGGQRAPFVEVHAPEHDRVLNPRDHSDHFSVADAVRTGAAGRGWNLVWHVDYDTRYRPANLTAQETAIKDKLFRAHDQVMITARYGSDYSDHKAWFARDYLRVQPGN